MRQHTTEAVIFEHFEIKGDNGKVKKKRTNNKRQKNPSKLVQVRGTAQTVDCIKDIAKKQEDITASGVLQQLFNEYFKRVGNERRGGKYRIIVLMSVLII